jgi:hypothetical protein
MDIIDTNFMHVESQQTNSSNTESFPIEHSSICDNYNSSMCQELDDDSSSSSNLSDISGLSDGLSDSSIFQELYDFTTSPDRIDTRITKGTSKKSSGESRRESDATQSTQATTTATNIKNRPQVPLKSSFSRKYISSNNLISLDPIKQSDTQGIHNNDSDVADKMFQFDFRVSFKNVSIRKYQRVLGDNPACSCGPSLSLGWEYTPEETFTVDEWEYNRDDIYSKDLIDLAMSSKDRVAWLRSLGYCDKDIKQSIKDINVIKSQRINTAKSSIAQKTEEVFVTVQYRLNKMLRKRSNSSNYQRQHQTKRDPVIVSTKAA